MGWFILFHNLITKERKGQAAPLLILLIAVVIVAMMVVVNIGKISLNRVDTQNASDAGALAAASWLASGQNYIADTSQIMFAASLGFIAMMAILGACTVFREPGGTVEIYALVIAFCALQVSQMIGAYNAGKMTCEQAEEQGKAYAFYNAGVDEYKESQPGEDYASYSERKSRFSQWLKAKGYKSGAYTWQDTKYRYWDSRTNQWVNYKPDRTNEVRVNLNGPSSFSLTPMFLPGFSISWYPPELGLGWVAVFCPFIVIPAFILSMSPSNPDVTVITGRKEPNADLGLWHLRIPQITSGAQAKTTGGGSLISGGDYDCKLVGAW